MYISTAVLTCLAGIVQASAKKYHVSNGYTEKMQQNRIKSHLMSKAKPLRKLDEEVAIDLTGYSILFEKCQYQKYYDVNHEDDDDGDDILSTNKFIMFKICNSNSCSNGCNDDYGEYVVDMDTYIEAMTQLREDDIDNMCDQCNNDCQVEDDAAQLSDDCMACLTECDAYDTMEENGYGDASEYVECGEIQADDDTQYSIGAYCSSDGLKISIGVFSDGNCHDLVEDVSAAELLGFSNFSDHVLMQSYSSSCISCLQEPDNDDQAQADDYEAETLEVCQEIYEASGKCETSNGFSGGYLQYYSSQSSNEEAVCSFIDSLDSGTFDQSGEIVIGDGGVRTVRGHTKATGGQKFFLTVLILATGGLAGYAYILHQKLPEGFLEGLMSQGRLMKMGGTMA
uniref:Uncharacterized protein n=1 Tax=Corethron hystrix TaxID=216773 RepID=A0A7S1FY01_9STRA|mmetsp:Transcript_37154/g.86645  ORF Transcript_37154/g.86645 Transcript_37154/m.86645 type:complete len:397 (+) Transcript_37154:103-1293(+)